MKFEFWLSIFMVIVGCTSFNSHSHSGRTDSRVCHAGSLPYHCHVNTSRGQVKNDYPKTDKKVVNNLHIKQPHKTSLLLADVSKNKILLLFGPDIKAIDFSLIKSDSEKFSCSLIYHREYGNPMSVYNEFYDAKCFYIEDIIINKLSEEFVIQEDDVVRLYLPRGIVDIIKKVGE